MAVGVSVWKMTGVGGGKVINIVPHVCGHDGVGVLTVVARVDVASQVAMR